MNKNILGIIYNGELIRVGNEGLSIKDTVVNGYLGYYMKFNREDNTKVELRTERFNVKFVTSVNQRQFVEYFI